MCMIRVQATGVKLQLFTRPRTAAPFALAPFYENVLGAQRWPICTQHATCDMHNTHHVTAAAHDAAYNMQGTTCGVQHAACNMQRAAAVPDCERFQGITAASSEQHWHRHSEPPNVLGAT